MKKSGEISLGIGIDKAGEIMSVCSSIDCKMYFKCARASANNEGVYTAMNKAEWSFVTKDETGKYINKYWCGEKGNYRLFKPMNNAAKNVNDLADIYVSKIISLQCALDKANETLAKTLENPPYYDCEAGRNQLNSWWDSLTHWHSVDNILPDKDQFVLVTDGHDYAVANWNDDTKVWEHPCFGKIEKEYENENPIRLNKITHWKEFNSCKPEKTD